MQAAPDLGSQFARGISNNQCCRLLAPKPRRVINIMTICNFPISSPSLLEMLPYHVPSPPLIQPISPVISKISSPAISRPKNPEPVFEYNGFPLYNGSKTYHGVSYSI